MKLKKIAIVGTGNVGIELANIVASKGYSQEIILIDPNGKRAHDVARDINAASSWLSASVKIKASSYIKALEGADLIVLCAGKRMQPEMSIADYYKDNKQLWEELAQKIKRHAPMSLVLTATDCDAITIKTLVKLTSFAESRFAGVSALAFSSLWSVSLAQRCSVNVADINSLFISGWINDGIMQDLSSIKGLELKTFLDVETFQSIQQGCLNDYICTNQGKYRYEFTTALAAAKVIEAITLDKSSVFSLTVCSSKPFSGVWIQPVAVSRCGVKHLDLEYSETVTKSLRTFSKELKDV